MGKEIDCGCALILRSCKLTDQAGVYNLHFSVGYQKDIRHNLVGHCLELFLPTSIPLTNDNLILSQTSGDMLKLNQRIETYVDTTGSQKRIVKMIATNRPDAISDIVEGYVSPEAKGLPANQSELTGHLLDFSLINVNLTAFGINPGSDQTAEVINKFLSASGSIIESTRLALYTNDVKRIAGQGNWRGGPLGSVHKGQSVIQ